jgi:P4 family phage/plasmid primase-like protien
VSKLKRLARPLIALAEKNKPAAFTYNSGVINMELFSEAGLAEFIAAGTGGRLLWCEPSGWLVYDEAAGMFITDHAEDVIFELVKTYRKKLLKLISSVDPDDQWRAFRFYKLLLAASTIRAVISLLKHESGIAALAVDFNRDRDLVNCAGIAVSADGTTRPAAAADRFTMSTAAKPGPGRPENFMTFIEWAACGDAELRDWILTAFGVAIFGHPTDRIINFYGGGRNGKGAALRTLFRVMKSYAAVLPRTLAIREPYTSSRFDLEGLVGKRMAALFDLKLESKSKLNLDELKTLTGNGDPQSVEPKGKKRFDAVVCCKIFIASNEKIPIDSFGDSEKERFFLVPFNNHVEAKDETLEERFVPEYGKILNLLIEYAVKYFKNGRKMPGCKAIDQATAHYFNSQDLIGQFIGDVCETGEGKFTPKRELYEKFVKWCAEEQAITKPMRPKTFFEDLEKRGFHEVVRKVEGKANRCFVGLVTKLQKNLNSTLLSREENTKSSNMKNENSCNFVTKPSENTGSGEPAASLYSGFDQREIWENKDAVLY